MRSTTILFLLSIIIVGGCDRKDGPAPRANGPADAGSVEESEPVDPAPQPGGKPNVVQREMQLLTGAMQTSLQLIANDQLGEIPAQIKKVHPARQATMKAVEAGEYQPPQNSDDIEGFKAMDDAFHEDLKKLLGAAKSDDLEAATSAYGDLVEGCTECHSTYRFEPSESVGQ